MSKIDDFIENLIHEDKVLADRFLANDAAEVFNDDDDPVEQFQDVGGRNIEPGSCHNVDG